jgi:hypothetical protein
VDAAWETAIKQGDGSAVREQLAPTLEQVRRSVTT